LPARNKLHFGAAESRFPMASAAEINRSADKLGAWIFS